MNRSFCLVAVLCAAVYTLIGLASSGSCCLASEGEAGRGGTRVREPETGVQFQSHLRLGNETRDYQLTLTGTAVRSSEMPHVPLLKVKVYAVAHYMESSRAGTVSDVFSAATTDGLAKQIQLRFVRNVEAQRLQAAVQRGLFQNLSTQEARRLEPLIEKFLQVFACDMRAGDDIVVSWLPGGRVLTSRGGVTLVEIEDQTFAKAVWAVWLGEHSVVDRNRLVSLWRDAQ